MEDTSHEMTAERAGQKGTLKSYVIGFILSIILTLAAYILVLEELFKPHIVTLLIVGLAILQICVQMLFFLHLGGEPKPQWNFLFFLFMALVVAIVVIGSLWIMYNLNQRVMPQMSSH